MHHQRTNKIKIADEMPSQNTRDGSDRRPRQQTMLFNLNAATMYQLLSIFVFYLLFITHDVVNAADNQPDGDGNNGVNNGHTVGPEAITTAFGECFLHFFISYFNVVHLSMFSLESRK